MTMPFSGEGQGTSEGGNELPQGMNPAWNDVLKAIPSDVHSQVIPHFQGWDQNFQKVQSQSAPYKEFIDANVDPENIKIALGLARALDENPQAVYQALHEEYGQKSQQGFNPQGQNGQFQQQPEGLGVGGQGDPGDGENPYAQLPPEFMNQYQTMAQQVETMRDILLHQHQETQQQSEDAELDRMYQNMMEKDPVFKALNQNGAAEPYMNSLFMAGYDEKQALEAFSNFIDEVKSYNNRPQPPRILGAGGFMPERTIRPRDMTEQQAKESVVHMIQSALHNQG